MSTTTAGMAGDRRHAVPSEQNQPDVEVAANELDVDDHWKWQSINGGNHWGVHDYFYTRRLSWMWECIRRGMIEFLRKHLLRRASFHRGFTYAKCRKPSQMYRFRATPSSALVSISIEHDRSRIRTRSPPAEPVRWTAEFSAVIRQALEATR